MAYASIKGLVEYEVTRIEDVLVESLAQEGLVLPEAICAVRSSGPVEVFREVNFGSKTRIFYSKKFQSSITQEQQTDNDRGVIRAPVLEALRNTTSKIIREMVYFSKAGDHVILDIKPLSNEYGVCGDKGYFCEGLSNYFGLGVEISDIDGNTNCFSLGKLEGKLHQYRLIQKRLKEEDIIRSLVTYTLKEITI